VGKKRERDKESKSRKKIETNSSSRRDSSWTEGAEGVPEVNRATQPQLQLSDRR
jgi:hypothetical protein